MKFRQAIPYIVMIMVAVVIFVAYQAWKISTVDSQPPTIQVSEGVLEISVTDSTEELLQGITAKDDVDGDVTASIVVEKIGNINSNNEISVTYAAFDSSGNVAKIRRTVRYCDYESPRFSLDAPLLFLYGRDVDIVSKVHVTDLIDGDISHKIKPTLMSDVPVSSEGVHLVLFRVTNSLGDTVEIQIPVEIYPTGKYNSTLTLTQYMIYIPQGGSFDPYDYLGHFTCDVGEFSLGGNIPEDIRVQFSGQVSTDIPGIYPISYLVTKENQKTSYTALSKLIVVVEG